MDKDLTDEEWRKFCDLVQALPEDLKQIMNRFGQRRGNPPGTGEGDNSRKPGRRRIKTTTRGLAVRMITNIRRTRVRVMMDNNDEITEGDPRRRRRSRTTTTINTTTTGGTRVRMMIGDDETICNRRRGRRETRIHID